MTSNPRRRSDRGGSAASIPDQAGSEPGRVADQRPLARRRIRRADRDLDRRRGRTTKRAKAGEDDACIGEAGELAPAPLLATVEDRTLKAARQQAAPPLARYSSSIAWLSGTSAHLEPLRSDLGSSPAQAGEHRRLAGGGGREGAPDRSREREPCLALAQDESNQLGVPGGVATVSALQPQRRREPVPGLPHAQRCGRDPGAFRELTDRHHERRIEIFLNTLYAGGNDDA